MADDPLIHGPSDLVLEPSEQESGEASTTTGANNFFDLRQLHPGEDLFYMVHQPRAFFRFFAKPERVTGWVLGKAICGLVLFAWLASFARGLRKLARGYAQYAGSVDVAEAERALHMLKIPISWQAAQTWLKILLFSTNNALVVLAPLRILFSLLLLAGSASLVLPLLGVDRRRVSFAALFAALAYAHWWVLLSALPFIPPGLLYLFISLFMIWMVKENYAVRWGGAVVSLYGFYFVIALFGTIALTVLFSSLGPSFWRML